MSGPDCPACVTRQVLSDRGAVTFLKTLFDCTAREGCVRKLSQGEVNAMTRPPVEAWPARCHQPEHCHKLDRCDGPACSHLGRGRQLQAEMTAYAEERIAEYQRETAEERGALIDAVLSDPKVMARIERDQKQAAREARIRDAREAVLEALELWFARRCARPSVDGGADLYDAADAWMQAKAEGDAP